MHPSIIPPWGRWREDVLACTSVDTKPYTHTQDRFGVADIFLLGPALVSDGLAGMYELQLACRPTLPLRSSHAIGPDDKRSPQHRRVSLHPCDNRVSHRDVRVEIMFKARLQRRQRTLGKSNRSLSRPSP